MLVINGQKADLTKSIYFMGLVQFLAIMGGVLAIVSLVCKLPTFEKAGLSPMAD